MVDKVIERISYSPYKLEFAKNVFIRICNSLYNNQIEITDKFENIVDFMIKWAHSVDGDLTKQQLNKAIGLIGNTGSRKTFLFKALQRYMTIDDIKYKRLNKILSFNFKIISSRKIGMEYEQTGYEIINKYSMLNILCIDDLGAEENCYIHFGNKCNIIESIFEERDLANKITHFSSNLNILKYPEIFIDKYGERVYSRVIKNTNIIELNDKDFRLIS